MPGVIDLTWKEPFPRSEFMPGCIWTYWMLVDRQMQQILHKVPRADQTKKEIVKNSSSLKNEKRERRRWSVREIDEYVIDEACKDACVKVANAKSVKKCSPGGGGGMLPSAHKNICVYQLKALGEGTSNNRLRSPLAYGLMGQ